MKTKNNTVIHKRDQSDTNAEPTPKTIIKKCHMCGTLIESYKEVQRCPKCKKSFLPLNYFGKVHNQTGEQYDKLFQDSEELCESDIIKGIYVLW